MSRLSVLEKELNKGIKVDEKSGDQIRDWSPNNVRRLLIGWDVAVVQYFVTGGRYKRSMEIIDFRSQVQKDVHDYESGDVPVKSILTALTAGRILSSVEEIYFCTEGYHQRLLMMDTDKTKLLSHNTSLENRFPRLRYMGLLGTSVQKASDSFAKTKEYDQLAYDHLVGEEIPVKLLVNQHEDDWWRGSSLRPKYYTWDSEKLQPYFDRCREKMGEKKREEELAVINSERNEEYLKKNLPPLLGVIRMATNLLETSNQVFEKSPILSKAEWSSHLLETNMLKRLKSDVGKEEDIQSLRRVDMESIIVEMDVLFEEKDKQDIIGFYYLLTERVFKADGYKRDSSKDRVVKSLQTLKNLALNILFSLSYQVYLSLATYLTRNTSDYASFYFDKIKPVVGQVKYTRSHIAYCNKVVESEETKKAFDNVGFVEVVVADFPFTDIYKEVTRILKGLETVK